MQHCSNNGTSGAGAIICAKRALIVAFTAVLMVFGLSLAITNPTQAYAAVSSDKQQAITINSDSLNGNAIRGTGDTVTSTAPAMDNHCYFYSTDVLSNGGFPTSGKITVPQSNITYQLGWTGTNAYDGNDCIRLVDGDPTKTMTLSTIGAYDQIYILATAGGIGVGHYVGFEVTLTYTDGTTDVTEYKLYDWCDLTKVTNVEQVASYMRMWVGKSGTTTDGNTSSWPILHSATITADKTKLLKSITFNSKGKDGQGSNKGAYSTIYAVTGAVNEFAPSTPVATPATNISSAAFTANWNAVSGATSYVLDVATDENFNNLIDGYNNKNVGSGTSVNVSVPNVGNQKYYYRVRAMNADGQSLSSNVISFDVPAALKITNLVANGAGVTAPTDYYNADGTQLEGFSYKFTVPTSENGYTAQVYDAGGTTAGDPFRVTNGYIQTISAGQYILVYGLSSGDSVTVQELTEDAARAPVGFNLTSRTKAGQEQAGEGNSVQATIVASVGNVAEQNQLVFTNTYQPTAYTIADGSFTARKTFTNGTWDDNTAFTIRIKSTAGTPMPAGAETDADGYQVITKDFNKTNKDTLLTCGEVTYTQPGTYRYTLNEVLPEKRAEGVTYSGAEYEATITISDNGKGALYVSDVSFVKNLNDDGTSAGSVKVDPETHDGRQVYVGDFVNIYDEAQASVMAEVSKNYTNNATGEALKAGQFSFKMEPSGTLASDSAKFSVSGITPDSSIPMPEATTSGSVTVENLDNGVATFPTIAYSVSGGNVGKAYVYKLTEVGGSEVGTTYDSSEYYMVVRCHAQNAGINVAREYYKADGTELTARPDFVNSYNVEPAVAKDAETGNPQLVAGTKVIQNRAWNEGESYTFNITPDDSTAKAIEAGVVTNVARTATATSDNNGVFTASPTGDATAMTFTKPGTYTFKVTEQSNNDTATSGISYDSHEGTVVYTVTDTHKAATSGKSQLAVSVKYNDMTFTNTYTAKGSYTGVKVTNMLTGRAIDSTNIDKFSFDVQGVKLDGSEPSIAVPTTLNVPQGASGETTVITAGDANTNLFVANTDQSMIGKKQAFVIKQTSQEASGYSFDASNGGAALVIVEVKAKQNMPSDLYTVTTIYKGAAVEKLNLDALTSADLAGLTPIQTIDSSTTSDLPQVDFASTYGASLDYGAQSDLQIHVNLAYEQDSAVTDRAHSFGVIVKPVATDTVTAEEAGKHLTTAPTGKVITTGELTPATAPGNTYTFNLKDFKFGAFSQDDANKTFAFDTNEIQETVGVDGYTFDTNTYRTFISVVDNGDGTLSALTSVYKLNEDGTPGDQVGQTDTCSSTTKGTACAYVPFSNTYKASSSDSYTPQVKKVVAGKDAKEDETFKFEMKAETSADGTKTATEQAIADGFITYEDSTAIPTTLSATTSGAIADGHEQVVNFDKIVFHKVGTYVFNITEKVPNVAVDQGWNYDQHTYTLTVTVRDAGGKLTTSVAGSETAGGSVFSNTYYSSTTLGKEGGLDIKKTLSGREQRQGDFTFKAEGLNDDSKAKINTIKAEGEAQDGTFTVTNSAPTAKGYSLTDIIEGLSFSNADKDQDSFKTFSFKISEVAGTSAGMTYDSNYYTVAITPYMKDDAIKLTIEVVKYENGVAGTPIKYDTAELNDAIELEFANTYKASGSWGGKDEAHANDLNANVTLTGRDLRADELGFDVYAVKTDQSSKMKVGHGTNAAATDGTAAKITLDNTLTFNLGEGMGNNKLDLLKAVENGYADKVMQENGTATYTLIFQIAEDTTQMPAGVRSVSGDPPRTLRLIVTDDGQGNLTAQVEYRTGETTGSVDFYDVYEKVKTVSLAGDTSATDLDGQPLSAGSEYTYSIKWVNNAVETDADGNRTSIAADVTITDVLPANVVFVSADNGGTYNPDSRTVAWELKNQDVRSYGTVKVTVRATNESANDKLILNNQAHVSVAGGSSYDSNTTSNQIARKTSSAGQGTATQVGDEITYTIEYANATAEAQTVVITDALPSTLEFVEASNDGTYSNGTVTWTLSDVASGTSGSVTVKARVLASAVNTTISNNATVQVGDGTPIQTTTAANSVSKGQLTISKQVKTDSGITPPDATFTFVLTIMDKDGNQVPASQQFPVTGSTTGMAFNGVTFNLTDKQSVTISDLPAGYRYSVEEVNAPEGFDAVQTVIDGSITADETASATFVNAYNPDEVQLDGSQNLKVSKSIDGRGWQQNDKFTFTLEAGDDASKAYLPAGSGAMLELGYNSNGEGHFGNIAYNKAGTYTYIVKESSKALADDVANLTVSYAEYKVVVTVADAGEGKLAVSSTTTQVKTDDGTAIAEADQKAVSAGVAVFTNSYATAADFTISNAVSAGSGMKPATGHEFKYTMELSYADGTPVTAEFGGLSFVKGKATFSLTDNASKTLSGLPKGATYKIVQEADSIYKTTCNDQETLSVEGTVGDTATTVAYKNSYAPNPTDPVSIGANVTVSGRNFTDNDVFTYKLVDKSDTVVETKQAETDAGKNEGNVTFAAISYDKPGTYTYIIADSDQGKVDKGVTHSDKTITVQVSVADDGNGKLNATVTYDGADTFGTFDNTYTVAPASVSDMNGQITVTSTSGKDYVIDASAFQFTLKNTEKPVACTIEFADQTVVNEAPATAQTSATFTFSDLTFPVAGTYKFTVSESGTTPAGVSNDGTVYEITYVATDNGEGSFDIVKTITAVKGGESVVVASITFSKTYSPEAAVVSLNGAKKLTNVDPGTTRTVANGEFQFQIIATNDAAVSYLPAQTTVSNAGTAWSFGDISFNKVGEYTYAISEIAGNDATITYDGTTFNVAVTVTDKDGVLDATVSGIPASVMEFENKYTPVPVSGEGASGTTGITGRDPKPGEFTVKIVDPEGNETEQTVAEDGTFVGFANPEFANTGTYEYVVSQVPGEHGGVTYDNSVYTITYKVTEDPDTHELVVDKTITKTKGAEPAQVVDTIAFNNTYAPVGTPEANVNAKVKIDGKDLGDGEFTFIIVDQDGNTVATGKNNADGTVTFDKITLPAAGTYHYTMKQESSTAQGVTTDTNTFPITITATDDTEGGYAVEVTYDGLAKGEVPEFNNSYVAPKPDSDGSGGRSGNVDGDNGGNHGNNGSGMAATADSLASVTALVMFVVLASAVCLTLARKRS